MEQQEFCEKLKDSFLEILDTVKELQQEINHIENNLTYRILVHIDSLSNTDADIESIKRNHNILISLVESLEPAAKIHLERLAEALAQNRFILPQ